MSATIKVDRDLCQGYGNCVLHAEEHFDLDDDGLVVLKKDTVDDGEVEAVRRAVYDCPQEVISLVEE